jgi:hypothetical protein
MTTQVENCACSEEREIHSGEANEREIKILKLLENLNESVKCYVDLRKSLQDDNANDTPENRENFWSPDPEYIRVVLDQFRRDLEDYNVHVNLEMSSLRMRRMCMLGTHTRPVKI